MVLLKYAQIFRNKNLDIDLDRDTDLKIILLNYYNYVGHLNWLLECQNFWQHYHHWAS